MTMTPQEVATKLRAFEKKAGSRAEAFLYFTPRGGHALLFAFYLRGLGQSSLFSVEANSFEEIFAMAESKWTECSDRSRNEMVRKMALAIIRITADHGECTDAALRADDFDAADLLAYSKDAIEDANKIASNGPFSIQKLRGANAA